MHRELPQPLRIALLDDYQRVALDAAPWSSLPAGTQVGARGGLVDEAALVDCLRERRIDGAGLDVFDIEPLPRGHPLLSLDNAVLAPHLGYATRETMTAFYVHALDHIRTWLRGDTPPPLQD